MKEFESNRTINGSYGEVWLDDDYLGEIESGKAEVDITYTDIQMARRIINGKKMTKAEGKGSIKLHHVRSNIAKKMSDAVKSGKTASCKIIMRLADPDAPGRGKSGLIWMQIQQGYTDGLGRRKSNGRIL